MMTDAQIAREYPDLSEAMSRVALLGETLEMARGVKFAQAEIGADAEKVTGLVAEIEDAEKTMTTTIVEILAQVSEQDLETGRDKDLLSPDDYREALTVKRKMELARGRSREQEHDLES